MRHVARTHSVAPDWLFDRINLHPKIQIKYVDNRSQLAGILTTDSVTRDEWNHLLQLCYIMDASLFSRSHSSSPTEECSAVSKRQMQEKENGEEANRVVPRSQERPCACCQSSDPLSLGRPEQRSPKVGEKILGT